MQYALTIYDDQSKYGERPRTPPAETAEAYGRVDRGDRARRACSSPARRSQPSPPRRPCACRNGERLVTDGPFAETKEQLGGFYLVDCKDLDEAIEWAREDPGRAERMRRGPAGHGATRRVAERATRRS